MDRPPGDNILPQVRRYPLLSGADIVGRVGHSGSGEGFLSLAAGGALAAVQLAAAVAGIGVGKVNTELCADGGDFCLGVGDEGTQDLQMGVGAVRDGCGHGSHEFLAAVGVEGVVASVGCNDEPGGAFAFGNACGNGQEDAVAEGNDGLLHVLFCVVGGGDGIRPAEQGAFQVGRNGAQVNFVVRHAAMPGLPAGTGEFPFRMVAAVVEGKGADHLVVAQRPM